jgi:hypothetical protein
MRDDQGVDAVGLRKEDRRSLRVARAVTWANPNSEGVLI